MTRSQPARSHRAASLTRSAGALEGLRDVAPRPRVVMTTEGTYPYFVGGVSSWCKQVIGEIDNVDWLLVPIVPASVRAEPIFELPKHASIATPIRLWSLSPRAIGGRRARADLTDLPSSLARALLEWETSPESLTALLVTCRVHARGLRRAFRSRRAWRLFCEVLPEMWLGAQHQVAPVVEPSVAETVQLYQTLYWIAQTAAAPTPQADLIHVTAAGWAAIPALVDRAINGTPILLTEHGMYVREAYLASVLRDDPPGVQWINTRIARALDRGVPSRDGRLAGRVHSRRVGGAPRHRARAHPPHPERGRAPRARTTAASRHEDGGDGRSVRPAQGHPHRAADRGAGDSPGPRGALPPLRPGGRHAEGVRGVVPPASSSSSAWATRSSSWVPRTTSRRRSTPPTSCSPPLSRRVCRSRCSRRWHRDDRWSPRRWAESGTR